MEKKKRTYCDNKQNNDNPMPKATVKSKLKTLVKDTIIFGIGSIGSKIILFLLVPLYTNYLSTEEYGIADLVFTISQLLIPFASLAIYNGVLRYGLSNKIKRNDVLLSGFITTILGSMLVFTILPIFNSITIINNWKWCIALYVMMSSINLIELNYLKVTNKNKLFATASIIQTIILASTNIYFLTYKQMGISGYIMSNIIAVFSTTIFIFFTGKIYKELKSAKFNIKLTKKMVAYSAPIIINDISWWIIHSSDKLMIEALINASHLGLYTVASKIPALINVLISIFSQAWGVSAIKEIESTNDTRFYSKVFELYSVAVFGIALIIIVLSQSFMSIYVSDAFFESWKYVPLLIASASFSAISSYYGSLYAALKKNMHVMTTTAIAAITNIIINYIFICIIGIWGALIGTVVAYLLISIIRIIDVNRYIKIHINWYKYIMNTVLILFSSIAITVNLNISSVAAISILLYIMINYKTLTSIMRSSRKENHE